MEVLTSIAIIISIIAIVVSVTKSNKIKVLEEDINLLRKRTRDLNKRLLNVENIDHETFKDESEDVKSVNVDNKKIEDTVKVQSIPNKRKIIKKPKEKVINRFIENWTGSLGVIFLVMGFAFLGVFIAFSVTQFPRFIIFVLFTAGLFVGAHFLSKKSRWMKISLWLRSAAGAIFLFSCVASSSPIDALSWIDNPIGGLILVLAGIIFNLYLGYSSKKELVTSVHVFLSLLALSIAPATEPVIIVATLVTLFGIYLTYKERWNINLLIIIGIYSLFHFYWKHRFSITDDQIVGSVTGLLCLTSVFFMTLFSHYRAIYSIHRFEKIPFFTHFINWLNLAIGIYVYFDVIPFKIFLLILGSITALYIAKRAKKLEIRWLYITDTLVANLLMIIAVLSLYNRGLSPYLVNVILLFESLLFLAVMVVEKEKLLGNIAYIFTCIFGFLVISINLIYNVDFIVEKSDNLLTIRSFTLLVLALSLGAGYYSSLKKSEFFKSLDNNFRSMFFYIITLMVYSIYLNNREELWSPYLLLLLSAPVIIYRGKTKKVNQLIFLYCLSGLFSIISLLTVKDSSLLIKAVYLLPCLAFPLLMVRYSFIKNSNEFMNIPGFIICQGTFLLGLYSLTNHISPFFTGISWLMLSVIYSELGDVFERRNFNRKCLQNLPTWLFNFALSFILLFFIRHIAVHINNQQSIGIFKVRYFVEILTLPILGYWIFRNNLSTLRDNYKMTELKGLFLELSYLYIIITVFIEVKDPWQPVIWISIALLSLFYNKNRELLDRIRFYSVVLAWLSLFHLAFITTFINIPNNNWYNIKWITGGLTIIINCLYLVLIKKHLKLNKVKFPGYLEPVKKAYLLINNKINLWVYYPFFICVAIFIYFTFDSNVITLFLVLESLIIFILSMFLREENFKIISMCGLGGCLIRLIFFDLKNSNSITRALVFIGVGIVMVVMNIVYMKFKEKYSNDENLT